MDILNQESFGAWVNVAVIAAISTIILASLVRALRTCRFRVNCWFCNTNTWVPFVDRNQWVCPSCEQYNGFKEDGDYNTELRAQFSPKYNKPAQANGLTTTRQTPSGAQLCDSCNRMQEMKVHLLASFKPSQEATFDDEVEQYKDQLEDTYRLCPGCERTVKRKLNQVKTLILKRSNGRSRQRTRQKHSSGVAAIIRRLLERIIIGFIVILIGQFFINTPWITGWLNSLPVGLNLDFLRTFWTDFALHTFGYRLALGLTILVLLGRGEPMRPAEYVSVLSLCGLHFLIGEKWLQEMSLHPSINDNLQSLEWILRIIALTSSLAIFLESLRKSPVAGVKLNNSFHRIEVEDDEELEEREDYSKCDSRSYLSTQRFLDRSTDFGSIYGSEYPRSTTAEDEEICNISRRSLHNKSDPIAWASGDQQNCRFSVPSSPPRPVGSLNVLHSPSKTLFPDDRFSNSIKSMRIGNEFHQIKSPATPNPFGAVSSASSSTFRSSSRSLLTPSRLSLVSGGFAESRKSPWEGGAGGGGFWNQQYPNVFTARTSTSSFGTAAPLFTPVLTKGLTDLTCSLDRGLNEGFVPLTESRSSSQSSGFESRQSTSSFVPSSASVFNDAAVAAPSPSVFSAVSSPWSERGSLIRRPTATPGDTMGMGALLELNVFDR